MIEDGVFGKEMTLEKFQELYKASTHGSGHGNRFLRWSQPITEEEIAIMKVTFDTKVPSLAIESKKQGFKNANYLSDKGYRIALKLVYKYRHLMPELKD